MSPQVPPGAPREWFVQVDILEKRRTARVVATTRKEARAIARAAEWEEIGDPEDGYAVRVRGKVREAE